MPIEKIRTGALVYVRYRDHVLFRDIEANLCRPWTRECIGWLDYEDEECVRILWERFAMPDPPNESKVRGTGLVILKRTIVEMHRLA